MNVPRWLLWAFATLLLWGVWALLSSRLGNDITPMQAQALSTLGVLPVLAGLMLCQWPRFPGAMSRGMAWALFSGIVSCLGNVAFFQVLNSGAPAATVIPLTALSPVVTILLAVLLLAERLNRWQTLGVVLSLVAIFLFNVQDTESESTILRKSWLFGALAALVLWGVAGFAQKIATTGITGEMAAIGFLIGFLPLTVYVLMGEGLPASLAKKTIGLTAAIGFTLALGNYAILAAFAANGKASIISPLAGLYFLVSVPLAVVLFGERIGWRQGAAIGLAIVAVIAMSRESPTSASTSPASENQPLEGVT